MGIVEFVLPVHSPFLLDFNNLPFSGEAGEPSIKHELCDVTWALRSSRTLNPSRQLWESENDNSTNWWLCDVNESSSRHLQPALKEANLVRISRRKVWNWSLSGQAISRSISRNGQLSMWLGKFENLSLKLTILRISRIHKTKGIQPSRNRQTCNSQSSPLCPTLLPLLPKSRWVKDSMQWFPSEKW